jgi:hypothetical protein
MSVKGELLRPGAHLPTAIITAISRPRSSNAHTPDLALLFATSRHHTQCTASV